MRPLPEESLGSDSVRRRDDTARLNTSGEMLLASQRIHGATYPRFDLQSAEFSNNDRLPTRATVDGDGSPPSLAWGLLLPRPGSLVLICEDPDAHGSKPFVHWLVHGISGDTQSLDANLNDFREGLNDHGEVGFAPAAPPRGDPAHRYVFQLFALDTELHLAQGATYDQLLWAMAGRVLLWGALTGRYERP